MRGRCKPPSRLAIPRLAYSQAARRLGGAPLPDTARREPEPYAGLDLRRDPQVGVCLGVGLAITVVVRAAGHDEAQVFGDAAERRDRLLVVGAVVHLEAVEADVDERTQPEQVIRRLRVVRERGDA